MRHSGPLQRRPEGKLEGRRCFRIGRAGARHRCSQPRGRSWDYPCQLHRCPGRRSNLGLSSASISRSSGSRQAGGRAGRQAGMRRQAGDDEGSREYVRVPSGGAPWCGQSELAAHQARLTMAPLSGLALAARRGQRPSLGPTQGGPPGEPRRSSHSRRADRPAPQRAGRKQRVQQKPLAPVRASTVASPPVRSTCTVTAAAALIATTAVSRRHSGARRRPPGQHPLTRNPLTRAHQ